MTPHRLIPYLNLLLVGVPILALVSLAPLFAARRWWGSPGLWITGIVWWALLGWGMLLDNPLTVTTSDDVAFMAGMIIGFATIPTYLIDRASVRVPLPPLWRRFLYGIGGYYLSLAAAFVLGLLVLIPGLLRR